MTHSSEVILTSDQARAYAQIQAFLTRPVDPADWSSQVFRLSGQAGTGKTELIGRLAANLTHAIISAPTNKAVNVLRCKGFAYATTLDKVLHKKQYHGIPREPSPQEIAFYEENDIRPPAQLIDDTYTAIDNTEGGTVVVVDEASMTNLEDLVKLMKLYDKIICVGDGFQLPPVEGEKWFQDGIPDASLHEIVRTAAQSEITQLVTRVRARQPWQNNDYRHEVSIFSRNSPWVEEALRRSDVVLAFKNGTCDQFNPWVRDLRNLPAPSDPTMPVKGDKLLAWQANNQTKIVKSDVYAVHGASPRLSGGYTVRTLDDGVLRLVIANKATLLSQKTDIRTPDCLNFSFAHCVTAHKSQGSEWDRVVVLAFDKSKRHDDYWNWCYTAMTRAKQHLTIVV